MVQVKPLASRAGSNSVLQVYIDQAVRAIRHAGVTRTALLIDRQLGVFMRDHSSEHFRIHTIGLATQPDTLGIVACVLAIEHKDDEAELAGKSAAAPLASSSMLAVRLGEFFAGLSKADADAGASTPACSLLQKKTDYTTPTIQAGVLYFREYLFCPLCERFGRQNQQRQPACAERTSRQNTRDLRNGRFG